MRLSFGGRVNRVPRESPAIKYLESELEENCIGFAALEIQSVKVHETKERLLLGVVELRAESLS